MAANIDYMMEMVKDYLSGKTPRYIFELDFQTEILARYKKMVREHREFAELFYDLLSEGGVDLGDGLAKREKVTALNQHWQIDLKLWIYSRYGQVLFPAIPY